MTQTTSLKTALNACLLKFLSLALMNVPEQRTPYKNKQNQRIKKHTHNIYSCKHMLG